MQSKLLYRVSHYLLSALFLFSGFTKGVNPFGLSIQFKEYFSAMGLPGLAPLSEFCAIALPLVEMMIGWMLLFGLYERFTRWAVGVIMAFFTALTLWIALENPVSDCGCFGDVIKISNWATLYKNIFFSLLGVIFFLHKPSHKGGITYLTAIFLLSASLPLYCYFNLPLIDSTPYAVGSKIEIKKDSQQSNPTNTILIYKEIATGKIHEFALTDTTWQDAQRWEFVESKQSQQDSDKLTETQNSWLAMVDQNGVDRASEVLSEAGDLYLVVLPDPGMLIEKQIAKIEELAGSNQRIVLLISVEGRLPTVINEYYTADRSTLHTVIQSKWGGIVLLNKGVIISKEAL